MKEIVEVLMIGEVGNLVEMRSLVMSDGFLICVGFLLLFFI